MSEREPKEQKHAEQMPEQLNGPEKQDLSNIWEALGTGNQIDKIADNETIRNQMWRDTQKALIENILPHLKDFERKPELEEAVMNATENSEERASAEYVLVENYMEQLAKVPGTGYSTTPKLSEKYEYGLNCVMASALAATLFEKSGIKSYNGRVSGHTIVLVQDSMGNTLYADPNGIVGKLENFPTTNEPSTIHRINESDQIKLNIPYKEIIKQDSKIGFVASMFNNLSESVLTTHDNSSKQLFDEHKNILAAQHVEKAVDKLFPNEIHISDEEHERIDKETEYDTAMKKRMKKEFFGTEEGDSITYKNLGETTIQEIRNLGLIEQISKFLNNPEQEHLPPSLSKDGQRILEIFGKELEQAKTVHPELRNRTIANFVKQLH